MLLLDLTWCAALANWAGECLQSVCTTCVLLTDGILACELKMSAVMWIGLPLDARQLERDPVLLRSKV